MSKPKSKKPRAPRTARERDQLELIQYLRRYDQEVFQALVTVLRHSPGKALVALGVIVDFIAKQAATGYR